MSRQRPLAEAVAKELVARALDLSPRTVEAHVARALAVLDCRSRAEAVRKAGELGVLGSRLP